MKKRRVLQIFGVIIGILLLAVGVGLYSLSHLQFDAFSPKDADGFITFLKAQLSQVFVVHRSGYVPPSTTEMADVVRGSYSAKVEADSKLTDAFIGAMHAADTILKSGSSGNWVQSSSTLSPLPPAQRLDPWGHNYCVLRRDQIVLVMTAGPNAAGNPVCRDIRVKAEELEQLPQAQLLESPAGFYLLVLSERSAKMGSPAAQ